MTNDNPHYGKRTVLTKKEQEVLDTVNELGFTDMLYLSSHQFEEKDIPFTVAPPLPHLKPVVKKVKKPLDFSPNAVAAMSVLAVVATILVTL